MKPQMTPAEFNDILNSLSQISAILNRTGAETNNLDMIVMGNSIVTGLIAIDKDTDKKLLLMELMEIYIDDNKSDMDNYIEKKIYNPLKDLNGLSDTFQNSGISLN